MSQPPCDVTLEVISAETVAKFLFDQHFNIVYRTVKPKAFEPPPDLEASVFRSIRLNEEAIWALGEAHVVPLRGRPLKGRADIGVQSVVKSHLQVVADNQPCRHAVIAGWPGDKAAQKSLAQQLAAAATFVPR